MSLITRIYFTSKYNNVRIVEILNDFLLNHAHPLSSILLQTGLLLPLPLLFLASTA